MATTQMWKSEASDGALPFVTVVMPVRNEAAHIKHSLGAVLAQDYPKDRMEVLVVDGESTDRTPEIVQQMLDGHTGGRLLQNPKRILPSGFNIGLAEAQGEVIVLLGGHTRVDHDLVYNCVRSLKQTGADCVGGKIDTLPPVPTAHAIALAMASPFGVGGALFRTTEGPAKWVDTVAFGAYRRDVFDRIGHFDDELGCNEDDEFNYRLRAAGGRIWLDPSIHSTYYCRPNLRSLFRQYFRYGLWKVRVFQKVPGSAQLRHWIPPLFVLALLCGLIAAALLPPLRPLYLAGLALYAVANLASAVLIAAKAGWQHLLRLALAFLTLHVSYGLGYWAGVARFGPPWRQRQQDG